MSKLAEKIRKNKLIPVVIALIAAIIALTVGLSVGYVQKDKLFKMAASQASIEYDTRIKSLDVFENSVETIISQTALYDVMYSHMTENGSGKTPKLLFIGYDGCFAEGMDYAKNTLENSATARLSETGGIWLTYCGGDTMGDQPTKSADGWTSILTGKWADETGVVNNYPFQPKHGLKKGVHTAIYTLADAGFNTYFDATWKYFFSSIWKREIDEADKKDLPATYNQVKGDENTAPTVANRIATTADGDAFFCTLEFTDHAGHSSVYSLSNPIYADAIAESEAAANLMIDAVLARPTYDDEDWLIVITTDHGGYTNEHGSFNTVNERYTFIVSNKTVF